MTTSDDTDPAVVDPERLAALVDAPVETLGTVGSTSDHLRRLADEGAPTGTLAVAEELTAGRGRTGSRWSAPRGGAWTSTLVRPDFGADRVGRLTLAGGVAAAETVRSFGVDARLKWPNDVLVGGRKVAGVLTEVVVDGVPVAGKPVDEVFPDGATDVEYVMLGIGVNADLDPDALDTDRDVTTLRAETGETVDTTAVVARLHERLMERVAAVESAAGFETLLDDWRRLDDTLGSRVRVERRTGGTVVGEAVGLTDRGALLVAPDDDSAGGPTGTAGEEGHVVVTEGECRRLRRRD